MPSTDGKEMPTDFFFQETLETRSVCNFTQPFTKIDLQVMKDKQLMSLNKLVSESMHTMFAYCCVLNVFFAGILASQF